MRPLPDPLWCFHAQLNHRVEKPAEARTEGEQPLALASNRNDMALAASARDAPGLNRWPLLCEMKRDTNKAFHFGLAQPGNHCTVHVLANQQSTVRLLVSLASRGQLNRSSPVFSSDCAGTLHNSRQTSGRSPMRIRCK